MSEDEPGEAEMESTESDALAEIVTECWIEPQSGRLVTQTDRQVHFNNLTYDQVASTFFELDRECISTLVTMEYLAMMCESAGSESVPSPAAGSSQHSVPGAGDAAIQQVPFCFDLPRLLRRCQQAEVLLSTLVQGERSGRQGPGVRVRNVGGWQVRVQGARFQNTVHYAWLTDVTLCIRLRSSHRPYTC